MVDVGLLGEEKGEEVEMRVKLGGGRVGEEGAVGGGSAVAARRRGRRRTRRARCYRRDRVPRTWGIGMLRFGRCGLGVHMEQRASPGTVSKECGEATTGVDEAVLSIESLGGYSFLDADKR